MNKLRYVFYLVLVAFFTSCEPSKHTLEDFCGGVVHDKVEHLNGCKELTIIKEGKEKKVCTYRLEWKTYKLGDTINCNDKNMSSSGIKAEITLSDGQQP